MRGVRDDLGDDHEADSGSAGATGSDIDSPSFAEPGVRPGGRRRGPSNVFGQRQRILVVEDDPKIGDGLRRALVSEGYEVEWALDGTSAARAAAQEQPDLVVLDLYLPDVDGVDVCQDLREAFPTLPIMILSARTDEIDIVVGLDAGADDYLVKPFRLAELLARIRAHLRRPGSATSQRMTVGDVVIDLAARRVTVGAADVDLRPKELDLLVLLAAEAGRLVSREPDRAGAVGARVVRLGQVARHARLVAAQEAVRRREHHPDHHDPRLGLPARHLTGLEHPRPPSLST